MRLRKHPHLGYTDHLQIVYRSFPFDDLDLSGQIDHLSLILWDLARVAG